MGERGQAVVEELVQRHHGVVLTTELRAAGVLQDAVGRAVHAGWLRRLRQGAFTTQARWLSGDDRDRHLLELRAQQRVHPDLVVTGLSAAVALRLPLPDGPPGRPQLTVARGRPHRGAAGSQAGAIRRRAWLGVHDVGTVAGLRVTTPVRTVVDCARHLSATWALAVADAAARRYGVTADDLLAVLSRNPTSPGHQRGPWVAQHLSPKPESPLESLARAVIILGGLPAPRPQAWISTAAGDYRVDLLDEQNGVVIEADGRLKYVEPQDLWNEKLRQDALQDTGKEVIRFTMRNHARPAAWLASYRRAQDRARGRALGQNQIT